jgi:tetratricopeptide (TPR) repeat protein
MSSETNQRALAEFEAGRYREARELAMGGLADRPDDVELLKLAGRCGVELGRDDAVAQLERATELAPNDADAWHALGEALATEGRNDEAGAAFRKAVELDPDDQVALTHLGHTSFASGRDEEGVNYLAQVVEQQRGRSTAAISLVDMYRTLGQPEQALVQARRIVDAAPDDVMATLDVAELSLAVGELDEAMAAFRRLRELDETAGNEIYQLHGMIQVELRREDWNSALQLAQEAMAADRQGLTNDVAAFLEAEISGPGEDPAPTRAEVDAGLEASMARYRGLHADDRRLATDDLLG